jgi:hypothetical protein
MPYYRHDCFNPHCCHYAGSSEELKVDVYTYRNLHEKPSMIIRKSNEGHDYLCMEVEFYRDIEKAEFDAGLDLKALSDHYNLINTALRIYDAYVACENRKTTITTS